MLLAWAVSAVFSKFLAYHETRSFLEAQAQTLASNMIRILPEQQLSKVHLADQFTQILLGWHNDQLVMQQGRFTLDRPTQTRNYIEYMHGKNWVISTVCEGQYWVLVGFSDLERRYVVRRLVAFIFLPLLLVLSLAMIAMNFAIRSGLQPLSNLAQTVSDTSVEKMLPLSEKEQARELLPLVKALNQLMHNMQSQLLKERQFLDTCTHELRTPVAGLVAQIQALKTSRETQLATISIAAKRTVRVANQFLSLAKNTNAEALSDEAEIFDLCELTRQLTADILSSKNDVECQMKGLNSLLVKADPMAMEMVCRNLIENSLCYGISAQNNKTQILICIEQDENRTIISVEDAGQGVEEQFRHKILERFYRVPGDNSTVKHTMAVEGAGLGLNIVTEVANRYHGQVEVGESERLGGLKVTVSLRDCSQES